MGIDSTESSTWCSMKTERDGMVGGRWKVLEGGDICTLIADSHCCMAETTTTL